MKKINLRSLILSILFTLIAVSVNAQNITSISQIKDVKPTDKHYSALQSLVERYGVFSDRTFRANDPLTREEFVVLLNNGLDRINEIMRSGDEEIFLLELIESFSANEPKITSMSQIRDINASYSKYTDLESLIERYGIDICDKDKYFRPTKPVTEKEFSTWIAKIFHGSVSSNPSATKALTRSDWAIVMNAAFDSVNERIAELVTERKSKRQGENQQKR
jgi:S-layer homology domain